MAKKATTTKKTTKKRFTFADAKAKIAQLEDKVKEYESFIAEEIANQVDDIKADTKVIGAGDIAFAVGGFILGALLVWIF